MGGGRFVVHIYGERLVRNVLYNIIVNTHAPHTCMCSIVPTSHTYTLFFFQPASCDVERGIRKRMRYGGYMRCGFKAGFAIKKLRIK